MGHLGPEFQSGKINVRVKAVCALLIPVEGSSIMLSGVAGTMCKCQHSFTGNEVPGVAGRLKLNVDFYGHAQIKFTS